MQFHHLMCKFKFYNSERPLFTFGIVEKLGKEFWGGNSREGLQYSRFIQKKNNLSSKSHDREILLVERNQHRDTMHAMRDGGRKW